MKSITEAVNEKVSHPIKVVQFGEGNFLRAFADYMIDVANEAGVFDGSVAIVKPIRYGTLERFESQNCLYTVILRGMVDGKAESRERIITSVEKAVGCYEDFDVFKSLATLDSLRFVVSNTTEAGITLDINDKPVPIPETYPGKLTLFLYERYKAFGGDMEKGLIVLPVELIEDNGKKLLEYVLALSKAWALPESFTHWIKNACIFTSTLVDRIVTGYPAAEAEKLCQSLGYTDELLCVAEPFGLWVIETDKDISEEFPLHKAGIPVVFTDNMKPFRERKVRILNGAHTSGVLLGWLCGMETVGDCMKDKTVRSFMKMAVNEEIKPFVKLPEAEVDSFAASVFERFENPYLHHRVLDISLNSVSKWKARVLPSFKDYCEKNGKIPHALTLSLAALMEFYSSNKLLDNALHAVRYDGREYTVRDDISVLEFFKDNHTLPTEAFTRTLCQNVDFWGEDLSLCEGLVPYLGKCLDTIKEKGARAAAQMLINGEL